MQPTLSLGKAPVQVVNILNEGTGGNNLEGVWKLVPEARNVYRSRDGQVSLAPLERHPHISLRWSLGEKRYG